MWRCGGALYVYHMIPMSNWIFDSQRKWWNQKIKWAHLPVERYTVNMFMAQFSRSICFSCGAQNEIGWLLKGRRVWLYGKWQKPTIFYCFYFHSHCLFEYKRCSAIVLVNAVSKECLRIENDHFVKSGRSLCKNMFILPFNTISHQHHLMCDSHAKRWISTMLHPLHESY